MRAALRDKCSTFVSNRQEIEKGRSKSMSITDGSSISRNSITSRRKGYQKNRVKSSRKLPGTFNKDFTLEEISKNNIG